VLDLEQLRDVLSVRPPVQLCLREIGSGGPVISTIHGSKGLEADTVVLFYPSKIFGPEQQDELKVFYVGATRARKSLQVINWEIPSPREQKDASRLFWAAKSSGFAYVELGCNDDFGVTGIAGTAAFPRETALNNRVVIRDAAIGTSYKINFFRPSASKSENWELALHRNGLDSPEFLLMAPLLKQKLSDISKFSFGSRMQNINHVPLAGTQTLVVPESLCNSVHTPWRNSRFLLAPIIAGFGLLFPASYSSN